jgi:protein-L-isoaspartate O-methyltransferase
MIKLTLKIGVYKFMKDEKLTILEDKITIDSGGILMMEWEKDLMLAHAKLIARGDVLEIGFGMGISAQFIQDIGVDSHTIVEIHPVIAERAREWAKDKPNVTIVEADWFEVVDSLEKYDGIFYDAELDPHAQEFPEWVEKKLIKLGGIFTFWNPNGNPTESVLKVDKLQFLDPIDVSAQCSDPEIHYILSKKYWVPFKVYQEE